jgi:putative oxidoreductase
MGRLARFLGDALRNLILLEPLRGLSDAALLLLRMLVGAFLMWGTWDNIVSAERMHEFVEFLTLLNCPLPEVAALISVYAQFACGALILLGLLTRWAGVVMSFNFIVAVALLTLGGGETRLPRPVSAACHDCDPAAAGHAWRRQTLARRGARPRVAQRRCV